MDGDRVRERRTRTALSLFAGTYLLFVVYGSLVPLQFQTLPQEEVWARFRCIPELRFDPGSRADWLANILLFIPLAFLVLGAIAPRRSARLAVMASGAVWIGCVALSVAIEYAQVYFPPRTTSLDDVVAETLGGTLGIAAWWAAGRWVLRELGRWRLVRGDSGLAEWLLWPYLLLVAACDLMPLDLSLRPHDFAVKWNAGRIVLLPFTLPVSHPLQRVSEPIVEALVWLPLAGLWLLTRRGGPLVAWCVTVLIASAIEVGQLLVISRVSDVTDILCAAAGAGAGVWLASLLSGRIAAVAWLSGTPDPAEHALATTRARTTLLALVACVAWSITMLVAFWYPFDFHTQASMFRARLHTMVTVPFAAYYLGSVPGAVAAAARRLLLFAPLGACLGVVCGGSRRNPARLICACVSLGLVASGTVVIALGQMFLGSKYPSFTDVIVEWCGGALGFWGVTALRGRMAPGSPEVLGGP